MIQQATCQEVHRYHRPRIGDDTKARRDAERRLSLGLGIGLGQGGPNLGMIAGGNPLTIITSIAPKLWLDSELGAGANTWVDQSTGGHNATEVTNPPSKTTIGTVPCYSFNGATSQFTVSSLGVAEGMWCWFIARQISHNGDGSLCGGVSSAAGAVFQNGASPAVSTYSGGVACTNPTAFTVGSWFRVKALFGASGYLQVGASGNKVTGNNGGGTDTHWYLGNRATGNHWGNFAIANVVVCASEPTAPEQTALDAWYAAKTFGGVVGF